MPSIRLTNSPLLALSSLVIPTFENLLSQSLNTLAPSSSSARLDAEVLLSAAVGCDRAYLVAHSDKLVDRSQLTNFNALLSRRQQGEPVAYILGHKEFWSLPIKTTSNTLIPRPETEHLVEQALARLPIDSDAMVFDLGTGSGAVAIAIAAERPGTRIIAVDICAKALAVAEDNARTLALLNISFRQGNWYAPLADLRADLIVSNPPYVRDDDPHLDKGDIAHEPALALRGGKTGMDEIEKIARGGKHHLQAKGSLIMEHGFDQGTAVRACLQGQDYLNIVTTKDYSGLDRITQCQVA